MIGKSLNALIICPKKKWLFMRPGFQPIRGFSIALIGWIKVGLQKGHLFLDM